MEQNKIDLQTPVQTVLGQQTYQIIILQAQLQEAVKNNQELVKISEELKAKVEELESQLPKEEQEDSHETE